jgi:hypothetical protein
LLPSYTLILHSKLATPSSISTPSTKTTSLLSPPCTLKASSQAPHTSS